jgi:hypothetical protein
VFPDSALNPMVRIPLEYIAADGGIMLRIPQTYWGQHSTNTGE